VTRRELFSAGIGSAVTAAVLVGLQQWAAHEGPTRELRNGTGATVASTPAASVVERSDQVWRTANANLAETVRLTQERLERNEAEKKELERRLKEAKVKLAAAENDGAPPRNEFDLTQDDWKQLASTGTIRYVLPCASFNPSPEVMDRLKLAPRDVPAIQSAFTAARDEAWSQIRPLCTNAVGSATAAERLGLDSCPQVILDAEKTTNPAGADAAMRAVGAVRAGLSEPSAIPAGDPVGASFLVLTGVAKEAEARLGAVFSAEDARYVVYGNNECSHVSEFASGAPQAAGPR